MDDSFVHWNLERNRFFYRYQNMLYNFEGYFFDFRNVDDSFNWVRYGLFNGDGNFFNDRDDNGFWHWNLDRYGVWHRNDDGLIDFELYVLRQRDDYLFVVLDRFRVLLFNVLVDGVDVGFQVMAAVVTTAIVTAGATTPEVMGANPMAAEVVRTASEVTGLPLWIKEKYDMNMGEKKM